MESASLGVTQKSSQKPFLSQRWKNLEPNIFLKNHEFSARINEYRLCIHPVFLAGEPNHGFPSILLGWNFLWTH